MFKLNLFWLCFPEKYIVEVIIPKMKKNLMKKINQQEFFVFFGCIFFMSCFVGINNHANWWSTVPIDMISGAPFHLNSFITRLKYTNKEAPTMFVDCFHEV